MTAKNPREKDDAAKPDETQHDLDAAGNKVSHTPGVPVYPPVEQSTAAKDGPEAPPAGAETAQQPAAR